MSGRVQGESSTGSKRREALFGVGQFPGLPGRLRRSAGCRVWDTEGREYLDFIMALGAVALGYGHPEVNAAAIQAIEAGVVGPLAPELEEELAAELNRLVPWIERVQFLKSGAEAVAAAVRIARAATGREAVLGCGYHGWHDWCQTHDAAVPAGTRSCYAELTFNDLDGARALIRARGAKLAAVVVEPVIETEPAAEWLATLRRETREVGAVLVYDEIKTGCRLAIGGAAERYGVPPDLTVMGKAIANGFPLALVGGAAQVMAAAAKTWISSTLATELVSFAACRATLACMSRERVPETLHALGTRLYQGLERLAAEHGGDRVRVRGLPEMCYLAFTNPDAGAGLARAAARRGILFKRSAYNFVSLAHRPADIDHALETLQELLRTADAD